MGGTEEIRRRERRDDRKILGEWISLMIFARHLSTLGGERNGNSEMGHMSPR